MENGKMSTHALKRIDATEGPIFSKMISFVTPLIISSLISQLYTVADSVVVGKFSTDPTALGAIGSTAAYLALLLTLFGGFSTGHTVVISHDFGAKNSDGISKAVHTSTLLALFAGTVIGALGIIFARPILELMNTKPEFIDTAVIYLVIRCIEMPFFSLFQAASASLRAVGDSRTPLYISVSTGFINVVLNVVFVIFFGMGADGVALATLISQIISAAVAYYVLWCRKNEAYAFKFSLLKFDPFTAKRILKFSIPNSIQYSAANLMGVFVSVATNSFDPEVIEAKTIAGNIDTVLATLIGTYLTVAMVFVGQNYGAGRFDRIKKTLESAIIQSTAITTVGVTLILTFRRPLVKMFLNESIYDTEAILGYATTIMVINLLAYFILGFNYAFSGFIKGVGHATFPMIVSLFDTCVLRTVWIFLVFPRLNTLEALYLVYPISWTSSTIFFVVFTLCIWKKKKMESEGRRLTLAKQKSV